jgi:NTE family protein
LIEWQLIRDLERLAGDIHVCIVPTLCPLDVSPYDFSASRYLIQRAADSTRKWLDRGGLSRQSSPRNYRRMAIEWSKPPRWRMARNVVQPS